MTSGSAIDAKAVMGGALYVLKDKQEKTRKKSRTQKTRMDQANCLKTFGKV